MERMSLFRSRESAGDGSISSIGEVEKNIGKALPIGELLALLGRDTFLIGGAVRDSLFNKKPGDFDLMTRASLEEIVSNLSKADFTQKHSKPLGEREFFVKKDEVSQNFVLETGVVTLVLDGNEYQVGLIGQADYNTLLEEGDLNLSCGAFDLNSGKIINPEVAEDIRKKILRFTNPEKAEGDPGKVLNALKAITKFPDLTIPEETASVIRSCIPLIISRFRKDKEQKERLAALLGNVNSAQAIDFFKECDGLDIFDGLEMKKPSLNVDEPYVSQSISELADDTKQEISDLMRERFGKRFKPDKVFNQKVNSVVYERDGDGRISACCLVDGERLYATAARNREGVIELVKSLCRSNYSIWTTISIGSKLLIQMAEDAGLGPVNSPEIMEKILVNHYPEYSGKVVMEKRGGYLTFKKKDEPDLQVLMLS